MKGKARALTHRSCLLWWCVPWLLLAGCAGGTIDHAAFTVTEKAVYAERAGQALVADLYQPTAAGRRAAVVVLHGGSWRKGNRSQMNRVAAHLAHAGYVVANVSYRLAPAHPYPAALEDARDAVRFLRQRADELNIDPQRIGAFGYSAGGHLAMLLATAPDAGGSAAYPATGSEIAAVVAGGTPADLTQFADSNAVIGFLGATYEERPELYRLASPITHAGAGDPPAFLYHGRSDWIVDIEQTRTLAAKLRAAAVPVELVEYTFGHIAVFLFGNDELEASTRFLDRHLAAAQR